MATQLEGCSLMCVRNKELKRERKEKILLSSKKRTENRRENSPPRVSPSKGFPLSQRANAQCTNDKTPLSPILLPLFISNKPLQLTN